MDRILGIDNQATDRSWIDIRLADGTERYVLIHESIDPNTPCHLEQKGFEKDFEIVNPDLTGVLHVRWADRDGKRNLVSYKPH